MPETTQRHGMARHLGRTYLVVPAAVLLYAVVLRVVYLAVVLPNFSYVGYQLVATETYIDVVSWITTTLVALLLPARPRVVSDVIVWVLFVVVIAPTMLMLPFLGPAPAWESMGLATGLGAAFCVTVLVARRRGSPQPLPLRASPTSFWLIVGLFSAVVYGYVALTVGINLQFLSILDVYDTRADYREALAEATLLGYLVSTQANVVNPLIIALGIQRRKKLMVLLPAAGQLILYTGTGFKTVLFSLVAIVVFVVLFKVAKQARLIALLWGAAGLLLVAWWLDTSTDSIVWTSIFGRRFLYTPARLSGLYFDWYSNNPLSLLGNSILAPWVDTDYQYGPARTIAIYATNSPEASLNANVYASGFAEFGWFGMFAVAVFLGVYLRVLDRSASRLPVWLSAIVAVMPAVTLSNTAFHTALLSHGLVAGVLLLAVIPRAGQPGSTLDEVADVSREDPPVPLARRTRLSVAAAGLSRPL